MTRPNTTLCRDKARSLGVALMKSGDNRLALFGCPAQIMKPSFLMRSISVVMLSVILIFASANCHASDSSTNVLSLGVVADGKQSATKLLQDALDSGNTQLVFPPGDYLIGSLRLPKGTTLKSSPSTRFCIDTTAITDRTLITLQGGDVVVDGGAFVFSREGKPEINVNEIEWLIVGKGVSNIKISNLSAIRQDDNFKNPGGQMLELVRLYGCDDVSVSQCTIAHMFTVLTGRQCRRVTISDNKASYSGGIATLTDGSEWIKFMGNWSSHCPFPFTWWGGDSNDFAPGAKRDTARIVDRGGARMGEPGYVSETAGAFDIIATGNYAEYGTSAIWGSKGRQIIISNNISRYMEDVGFDTEGGEKVIISNNISINSTFGDYACFFYGEELIFSSNIATIELGDDVKYQGYFLRVQSGGGPDHFGSGRVLIEGNLFSSRMSDKPRPVMVETSRDVVISNNKFVNGYIAMTNEVQSMTITGNDFRYDLKGNFSAIVTPPGVPNLTVRNNQFFRLRTENNPASTDAAFSPLFGTEGRRTIEGNIVDGWQRPFDLSTGAADSKSQVILLRNSVTGEIAWEGRGGLKRVLVLDNISLSTLRKINLPGSVNAD